MLYVNVIYAEYIIQPALSSTRLEATFNDRGWWTYSYMDSSFDLAILKRLQCSFSVYNEAPHTGNGRFIGHANNSRLDRQDRHSIPKPSWKTCVCNRVKWKPQRNVPFKFGAWKFYKSLSLLNYKLAYSSYAYRQRNHWWTPGHLI